MFNVIPFEILKQDKDEVIMLINYMCEKGERKESSANEDSSANEKTEKEKDRDFWSAL